MDGLKRILTSNSSFETLRKGNYIYVDKTAYLHSLVSQEGAMFFFSRPRRFGKSLTVSTLEAIFRGKRELFKGLAIDQTDYDWKTYPVVHIDFGNCGKKTPTDLERWLKKNLQQIAQSYSIAPLDLSQQADDVFTDLLLGLAPQGKIVILVDEYDKVLSDNALASNVLELRDTLKGIYDVIKTKGALLRFVFITGVTKFSKVGIFSGMNNLYDASLDPGYGTMMGYTQKELEENFAGHIDQGVKDAGMDREAYLAKIKEMYDGYKFTVESESVYNPVSIGLFFTQGHGRSFEDYWIDTGNMKLVMDMATTIDLDVSDAIARGMSKRALESFDIANLKGMKGNPNKIQALLLQTGYLTIDHEDELERILFLRVPNGEVEDAYDVRLLECFHGGMEVDQEVGDMCYALKAGDTRKFIDILSPFMSGITYPAGTSREVVFATVVATLMRQMRHQLTSTVEDRTSGGRIDLSVVTDKHVYVIEYKVDQGADVALKQIREKRYADKFRLEKGKTIHLVGISFSSANHAVLDWKEEILD